MTYLFQLCGTVHPGMAIDHDAVLHIRDLVSQIVSEVGFRTGFGEILAAEMLRIPDSGAEIGERR